jgi:two-component system sensor histidine kinase/response regulator
MSREEEDRLAARNYFSAREATYRHTDGLFAWLMVLQWIFGVGTALWLSPSTWKGSVATIHPHVLAAVFLGGIIVSLPVLMAWKYPGKTLTRHTFAIAQMLYGALLIHLTGGRIETHFHVFGSLAFLAFYRDSWVLVTASLVVLADHFLRGMFWPESVYGAVAAPIWRSLEHAAWVVFEDIFLIVAIRRSLSEMQRVARREAELEILNARIESKVGERTRKLAESEERFSQLANNTPDVFWFIDLAPVAKIRYVSPSILDQWGVPPEHFYNDPNHWLNCVPAEDRDGVIQAMTVADEARGIPMECEHRVTLPDGQLRRIHFRGTLKRDDAGNPIRLAGLSRDITEQMKAEEKIRLDAQRLRLATQAAGIGIWNLDIASGDLEWDDEAYRLYGIQRRGSVSGYERWRKSVHPEDLPKIEAALQDAIRTGAALDSEFRIRRGSEQAVRLIRVMATIVWDEDGKAVRVIGVNWDTTEERERETVLRQSLAAQTRLTELARAGERAKQEFLATMSHEIRTPLSGMLGFADAALESKEILPDTRDCLHAIKDGGDALMRIINDILDFSRIGAGRLRIEKAIFSPVELVEDVRLLFSHQAFTRGLTLQAEVDENLPHLLRGDGGRIRQILLNLVGNAVKFTVVGDITITVRINEAGPAARRIEFVVDDTGPGIPPDKLRAIFDPFTQADSSNTRRHGGVGLGLAISSRLAQLMGGGLSGENLTTGARFVFSLPMEVASAEKAGAAAPGLRLVAEEENAGVKVLVVEDDKINRALLLRMLRDLGYKVVTAVNGSDAVEAFRHESPALIVMDVQMPVLDGIEATERIREFERVNRIAPCFIVALTADIMPENRENCMRAGMNAYLNKPIKKADLSQILRARKLLGAAAEAEPMAG